MLVDSNIFLEFLLKQKNADKCKILLNNTAIGEVKAVVSDFTIDSIALVMGRNKLSIKEIYSFVKKLVNSEGIRIYFVNIKDRFAALALMEKYNLDYEDAIVLQSALSAGCKEIVSFDRDFDNIKEIKRVEP